MLSFHCYIKSLFYVNIFLAAAITEGLGMQTRCILSGKYEVFLKICHSFLQVKKEESLWEPQRLEEPHRAEKRPNTWVKFREML